VSIFFKILNPLSANSAQGLLCFRTMGWWRHCIQKASPTVWSFAMRCMQSAFHPHILYCQPINHWTLCKIDAILKF